LCCKKVSNSLGKLATSRVARATQRNLPKCLETFDLATSLLPTFTFPCAIVRGTSGTFKFVYTVCEILIDAAEHLKNSQFKMITRFITEVSTTFNPFLPRAKVARLFLSFLPPNARQTMKVDTKLLPRASRDPSFIQLKFSKLGQGHLDRYFLTQELQRMESR
jgi:large subunit ribosomal protein L53